VITYLDLVNEVKKERVCTSTLPHIFMAERGNFAYTITNTR